MPASGAGAAYRHKLRNRKTCRSAHDGPRDRPWRQANIGGAVVACGSLSRENDSSLPPVG